MNPLFPLLFQQNRNLVYALNEALKPFGLYHAQWSILYLLHQQGKMTLTDIWRTLNVEAPTVTRTITRLEQLGYVERTKGTDKREKIVALTEQAYSIFPHVQQAVIDFENSMVSGLTEQEQQQFIYLLNKMKE